jgi:hypothetical protein
MLDGVILLWFILTAMSLAFVVYDIRSTPESVVLKWGFILLVAYTGPIGLFLYVLGCREPLSGLHERYVAVLWRQVLGSTMHCVSGDGVGILAGAVIGSLLALSATSDIMLEYALGFGFGWTIFQSLFMKDSVGGSYTKALWTTFIPELVSMNALMAGMVPLMRILMANIDGGSDPLSPRFWFIMSMALLLGFIIAYPMNWWLVARGLKHGMMTVRPEEGVQAGDGGEAGGHGGHGAGGGQGGHGGGSEAGHGGAHGGAHGGGKTATVVEIAVVTLVSFGMLAVGLGVAMLAGTL